MRQYTGFITYLMFLCWIGDWGLDRGLPNAGHAQKENAFVLLYERVPTGYPNALITYKPIKHPPFPHPLYPLHPHPHSLHVQAATPLNHPAVPRGESTWS